MDLDALREALGWWGWNRTSFHPDHVRHLEPALAAARAVLDSEETWWCKTHDATPIPTSESSPVCGLRDYVEDFVPCSMVRRRLLAEEGT